MNKPQPSCTPYRPAPRQPRVLVLDDDPNMRELLTEVFLLEGYDVETADSLAEERTLLETPWDAAMIDVRLGSQDGLEFLVRLRARQPQVVAMVLTGFSSADVALKALRAGADDYFGKPVDTEKLKIAVRRGLERVTAAATNRALIQDLHGLNEQLRHARALLQRRGVSSAEEGAAYLGILAEGAAREIRGPLAAIRTSLDVLNGNRRLDERSSELVDYALGEAVKIERTLANLASLVRPGGETVVVDLTEILQNAVRFAGEQLARRKITALIEAGEVAPIAGDPWRLFRAVLNMILFSMERMPAGGNLTAQIHVDPEQGLAECRISDTGQVVPPAEIEALFEPLDPKSSGALGLPAARAIVEETGGRVWAEPRPSDAGMVFCLRMALADSEEERTRLSQAS